MNSNAICEIDSCESLYLFTIKVQYPSYLNHQLKTNKILIMKNFFVIFAFVITSISSSFAQTEISVNPISIAFRRATIGLEQGLSRNVGIKVGLTVSGIGMDRQDGSRQATYKSGYSGVGYIANLKYYIRPSSGLDGFYAGMYARDIGNRYRGGFRGGLNLGYKIRPNNKIFLDLNVGGGVSRNNDMIGLEYIASILSLSDQTTNHKWYPDILMQFSAGYRF